jgi:ABC-type nickel/cobalt efflux system permease component RcnA
MKIIFAFLFVVGIIIIITALAMIFSFFREIRKLERSKDKSDRKKDDKYL